jgi:nitronate monooxygenase
MVSKRTRQDEKMTDLKIPGELPIIQAPMAGGPSTPELTAAVADAGGFGFLAAGYLSPAQLVEQIGALRALSDAPFGINIFHPSIPSDPEPVARYAQLIQPESDRLSVALGDPHWDDDAFDDKVDVAGSERVDMVSFTFGCPPPEIVDRLHSADCRVAVTVTSSREALVAEEAGVDLLLVQGTEAGGHQGSFLDLAPNVTPLLSLLDDIRESAHLPMVASGGIMTGEGGAEALEKGAIGIQLGTAFLCCSEAGTSATYRRALLEGRYPETVITRAFSGRFARGLANEFADNYGAFAPEAYPEIHHLTRPLRASATAAGDPSTPNFWAGLGWPRITPGSARAILHQIAHGLKSTG